MLLAVSLMIGYAPIQAASKPPSVMEKSNLIEKIQTTPCVIVFDDMTADEMAEIQNLADQNLETLLVVVENQRSQIEQDKEAFELKMLPLIDYDANAELIYEDRIWQRQTINTLYHSVTPIPGSRPVGRSQVPYFNKLC